MVLSELEEWLKKNGRADYITLSGSGEPTLHPRFGEVLKFIRKSSSIPAVLLTNGTTLHLPEVRDAAACANVVKVSLSAWDQASYVWVNRPHPELRFDQLIEGQKAFRSQFKGQLWMEVFLVGGINSMHDDVQEIATLAQEIGPDRIHLNTAVRPPAEDFATALSKERMESLIHLFHPTAEIIADFICFTRPLRLLQILEQNMQTIFRQTRKPFFPCCSDDRVQLIRLRTYSVCISMRCRNISAVLYVTIRSARNAKIAPCIMYQKNRRTKAISMYEYKYKQYLINPSGHIQNAGKKSVVGV
jgi:molybdenum cofactor biosynthesis enzyme MoaA